MKHLLLAVITALVLSACVTGPHLTDSQKLDLYRAHAGAPVESFHYLRSLDGWTPLGDSALAVWVRPDEAYLLELTSPCPDLDYAPAISITNQFGRVYADFDEVVVLGRNGLHLPCRIEQIRPVDVAALEQAEDDLREQIEMVERAQSAEDGAM